MDGFDGERRRKKLSQPNEIKARGWWVRRPSHHRARNTRWPDHEGVVPRGVGEGDQRGDHSPASRASNKNHTVVKLASVPVEVRIGERVTDPGVDYGSERSVPFGANKIGKQTLLKKIASFLMTGHARLLVLECIGCPDERA